MGDASCVQTRWAPDHQLELDHRPPGESWRSAAASIRRHLTSERSSPTSPWIRMDAQVARIGTSHPKPPKRLRHVRARLGFRAADAKRGVARRPQDIATHAEQAR